MDDRWRTGDILEHVIYWQGWACGLDEVAIFDEVKDSAAWVTSVYNTGPPDLDLSESGLVGYWKFNEGSGTTVKDYSGNGNHGTFAPISGDTTAYPTWEGLSYTLEFTEFRDGDTVLDHQGVTVYLDKKSTIYLSGIALDHEGGLSGKGFVFRNPHATNTCGCGESFSL